MRLDLTEILACPVCGPAHGMIAFVERLEAGFIVSGHVDCPQCEIRYPVRDGVLEIGSPPRGEDPAGPRDEPPAPDEAALADALVGPSAVAGPILVVEGGAYTAGHLAASREGAVIEYSDTRLPSVHPAEGVTRIVAHTVPGESPGLPFRSGSIGAIVLGRSATPDPLELSRVLREGGRFVVLAPGSRLSDWAEIVGVEVLAADARALVAVRVAAPGGGA